MVPVPSLKIWPGLAQSTGLAAATDLTLPLRPTHEQAPQHPRHCHLCYLLGPTTKIVSGSPDTKAFYSSALQASFKSISSLNGNSLKPQRVSVCLAGEDNLALHVALPFANGPRQIVEAFWCLSCHIYEWTCEGPLSVAVDGTALSWGLTWLETIRTKSCPSRVVRALSAASMPSSVDW